MRLDFAPLPRFVFLCASLFVLSDLVLAQQTYTRPLIVQPVDETNLTVLKGNTHPLARPQFDQGAAPPSLPMERMLLVLKRRPEQETALQKLLDDQQDKASPNYHKWLTPDEFGQQFGPADQDIQIVMSWLQSHGFQVAQPSRGRVVIEFSGTAAQVEEALHTSIHKYVVNGEEHWANANDPRIPTALTAVVAGVHTLHNFYKRPMNRLAGIYSRPRTAGQTALVTPLFTFPDQNACGTNCYAVSPYDFATIYNVLPLWNTGIDGSGQTIAIVGRSNIHVQDARDFRSLFGLPLNDPTIILNGPDPGPGSDETEADIDVQWSGAVARKATIDLVVSRSTETTDGVDLSAVYVVDNNLAPVMSESFGACELALGTAGNQFFSELWAQAAAQGITVFVSSGDNGSAGCDFNRGFVPQPAQFGLAVSGIASTPFNVAVGGTDFNDFSNPLTYWNVTNDPTTQASAKGYIPETTWNDSCTNSIFATIGFSTNAETNCNDSRLAGFVFTIGGSGGTSNCTTSNQQPGTCSGGYAKPSWQTGTGVPADNKRDLPDVSLFASNGFVGNFYVLCQSDASLYNTCDLSQPFVTFFGVGGTSVSSPALAGIMALVNQQTGSRQGNANYVFYKLAAQQSTSSCNSSTGPANSCVFNDVISGTIAMPCVKGSLNCNTTNSSHQFGVLSGYGTTPGYDLATGLGSVNAANLVNKWSSLSLRPSVTTLTSLSPTTTTHGQGVNVSVTVAPQSGSGTPPTGAVSLIGTPNSSKGIADFTLANGTASDTTDLLPGGTYSVFAHYPGDGIYSSSDSNTVAVNITPESSKTFANLVTLDVNGNPTSFTARSATYGSGFFLLRVDVGDSGANVSSSTGISSNCSKRITSCPAGMIALTANGSPLAGGSLPLNSEGFAEDQSLAPGGYLVSASYPGDSSYGPSASTSNFTIAKAPTTAVAAVAGLPVEYGNSEEIAAGLQTTSNGAAPTGTFTFSVDGSPITPSALVYESAPYNPNSSPPSYAWLDASGSTEFLSVGDHTLSVQYSGDANYAAATSAPSAVTVTKAQSFFNSWGASPSPANLTQQVTLSAQLYGSQAGVAPTGTITFSDGSTALSGTVTYTRKPANGLVGSLLVATMPYTPTTPGTHNISVSYSGDGNYLSATTPIPNILTVIGPFSVTPTGDINISSPGQSGSTTVTVSPNGGFTGAVNLSCTPDPGAKESGCSFGSGSSTSPTVQVNLNGSNATVTFNVTTTAPHPLVAVSSPGIESGIALSTLVVLFVPVVARRRRISLPLAALALTLSLGACGGGGSSSSGGGGNTDPGTAPGIYTFTITGTTGSGSSAISLSIPVAVSVR